jgi:hypothetical protein
MTRTYEYELRAFYNGAEAHIGIDGTEDALDQFFIAVENAESCDLSSGLTGEVLASHSHTENYIANGFDLTILGYLMKRQWEEESADSAPVTIPY